MTTWTDEQLAVINALLDRINYLENRVCTLEKLHGTDEPKPEVPAVPKKPKTKLEPNHIRVKVFVPALLQERAMGRAWGDIPYTEIVNIARERGFELTLKTGEVANREQAERAVLNCCDSLVKKGLAERSNRRGTFCWNSKLDVDAIKAIARAPTTFNPAPDLVYDVLEEKFVQAAAQIVNDTPESSKEG